MWYKVHIENHLLDYDTVKNSWLSNFETKNDGEDSFLIKINKPEDFFEIVINVGEDIRLDNIFDEDIIII